MILGYDRSVELLVEHPAVFPPPRSIVNIRKEIIKFKPLRIVESAPWKWTGGDSETDAQLIHHYRVRSTGVDSRPLLKQVNCSLLRGHNHDGLAEDSEKCKIPWRAITLLQSRSEEG